MVNEMKNPSGTTEQEQQQAEQLREKFAKMPKITM